MLRELYRPGDADRPTTEMCRPRQWHQRRHTHAQKSETVVVTRWTTTIMMRWKRTMRWTRMRTMTRWTRMTKLLRFPISGHGYVVFVYLFAVVFVSNVVFGAVGRWARSAHFCGRPVGVSWVGTTLATSTFHRAVGTFLWLAGRRLRVSTTLLSQLSQPR